MTSGISGFRPLAAGVASAMLSVVVATGALAETLGRPTDGAWGLQSGATEIREHQIWFHDWLLLPLISFIALFVLALLVIVVVRFNAKANPTPARWSHNTPIEIAWTVIPVVILAVIAIFSFRLLFEEHDMPKPDLTVKVVGRQWNWDYEYPDQKISAYTSTLMTEADAKTKGVPYQLAANAPMYAPVGKVVRVLVTAEDVIHDFSVPGFGIKIDAVPGRLNETWFKATKTGVFYGQCDQLCGMNHSYMPIEVHVVSQAEFDAWVASKAPKAAPVAVAMAVAMAAPAPAAPAASSAAPQ